MGRWEEGRWVWNVVWSKEIREREQQGVEAFLEFIHQFELTEGGLNRWCGRVEQGGVFCEQCLLDARRAWRGAG